MWLLDSCRCVPLEIALPDGTYLAPPTYDEHQLLTLGRLLCRFVKGADSLLPMSWRQAASLESAARLRQVQAARDAIWALAGDPTFTSWEQREGLSATVASRFPTLHPRWVLVLDERAASTEAGWLEAHVKMPLVACLEATLADPGHPFSPIAVERFPVRLLATWTSDPLELLDLLEATVQHRLDRAVLSQVEDARIDDTRVDSRDWKRSLFTIAAQRLASRLNALDDGTRHEAARFLQGDGSSDLGDATRAELARTGVLLQARQVRHSALTRTVLEDPDARTIFWNELKVAKIDKPRAVGAPRPKQLPAAAEAPLASPGARTSTATPALVLARQLEASEAPPQRIRQAFEDAVSAAPDNVLALGEAARFLHTRGLAPERADELYQRALQADPNNAGILGNFAVFLWSERHDLDAAETMFRRAFVADSNNANNLGNFAHSLLLQGRREEGLRHLRRAAALTSPEDPPSLPLELDFYRAVHVPEERAEALERIQELASQGVRSPGWDFGSHVDLLEAAGDPDASLFRELAQRLSTPAEA